jgi:hypothetical protein
MASYTRLGTCLLSDELSADPFGKLSRALILQGSALERHVLVRSFSEEMVEAGLGSKIADAAAVASRLAGSRGFGTSYRIEGGRTPHVVCDYVAGRSLAQVLEKARVEQVPVGVDHALSVLQGLSASLAQMHGKCLSHGVLSPHSVWMSIEGAAQLLDAPFAPVVLALLPRARNAEIALKPYRQMQDASPLQQDLFAMGAIFFELLTLERVPARAGIPAVLDTATLKAAQEDSPIPPELRGLLERLLSVDRPFESMGAFNEDLEGILYEGHYSPTTFNMAFFMHTLFRDENERDLLAMKDDASADFTPFLPSDGPAAFQGGEDHHRLVRPLVMAGAGAAVLILALVLVVVNRHRRNAELERMVAQLQQRIVESDNRLSDLDRQESVEREHQKALESLAASARTDNEREQARKALEDSRAKSSDLAAQKAKALQEKSTLTAQAQTILAKAPAPEAMKLLKTPEPAKVAENVLPPPPAAPEGAPAPQTAARPSAASPASAPAAPQAAPQDAPPPLQAAPAPQPVSPSQAPVPADTAPVCTNMVQPAMPSLHNRAAPLGNLANGPITLEIKVFVDAAGKPLMAHVTRGVPGDKWGFGDSAHDAAMASTYAPAIRNGKPVASFLTMVYNFGRVR